MPSILVLLVLGIATTCLAVDLTIELPNQGTIVGKIVNSIRTKNIRAFLGIPYARPPRKVLRFTATFTDTLPNWEGIRNATTYAPACLQHRSPPFHPFEKLLSTSFKAKYSEDCLYLNVFTPIEKSSSGYATIVWIHPGNFTSGHPAQWDPYILVYKNKVIVVTFSYRLGILGFFSSLDGEAPGNFGIQDQQAAMQWVKNNIGLFGGDPDNICLMGYGSGAVSVALHMTIPSSQPLFAKAIAMSGNFLDPTMIRWAQEGRQAVEKAAMRFGCDVTPTSLLMKCLRNLAGDDLTRLLGGELWRPIIDVGLSNATNALIAAPLRDSFLNGEFYKVPLLTGFTNMEGALLLDAIESLPENFTGDVFSRVLADLTAVDVPNSNSSDGCYVNFDHVMDTVLFYYIPSTPVTTSEEARKLLVNFKTEKEYGASSYFAASLTSAYNDTFMYRFDVKPSTKAAIDDLPDWASVPHMYDLIYIWGIPFWEFPNKTIRWDKRDKDISEAIMRLWTNFAKYSYPTKNTYEEVFNWELFDSSDPKLLVIDGNFAMRNSSNFDFKAFEFWNTYFPKVLEASKQCCNVSSSSAYLRSSAIFVPVVFYVFGF